MMDYTELIEDLRLYMNDGTDDLRNEAADAIERLADENTRLVTTANELSKMYDKLVDEMPDGWISVTERLPEPGEPCLCWCKGGTYGQIRWYGLYYLTSHRTWAFYDNDYIDNREVTHWMYRPEPPKEET